MPDEHPPAPSEPWWTRNPESDRDEAGSQPRKDEDDAEVGRLEPDERAVGARWLGQREPFLRALAGSLEPLEDRLARVAEAARANHAELTRLAQETHEGLRAVAEALVEARAIVSSTTDEVAARADAAREAADEARSTTRTVAEDLAELLRSRTGDVEQRLAAGEAVLAQAAEAQRASAGSLSASFTAVVGDAERRLAELLERLEKQGGETRAATERQADSMRTVEEAMNRGTADLAAELQTLGARLDALASSSEQLAGGEAVEAVATRVEELATNVGDLVERARAELTAAVSANAAALRERHDRGTDRLDKTVAKATRSLQQGLDRVERLGALIEAMATRRGFRELVESEQRLREEQAAFVAGLSETARSFEGKLGELQAEVASLDRTLGETRAEAAALRQVPGETSEQVDAAMTEAGERLAAALRNAFAGEIASATAQLRTALEAGVPVTDVLERLDRLAGTQRELGEAHRDVASAAGAIERAGNELLRRIEGWGKPRSAPHLAQELVALDERIAAVETRVADELAPALAKLVTEQLLDALDRRDRERPRGLLRRR